ncbi:hypothetical protein D3C81_1399760 [compost metagenome]
MKSEQTVAATQVVVEEAEGASLCQRHQPDGQLGELDSKRVQIDAVQTTLGDEATRDH